MLQEGLDKLKQEPSERTAWKAGAKLCPAMDQNSDPHAFDVLPACPFAVGVPPVMLANHCGVEATSSSLCTANHAGVAVTPC